jgi:hypothetical protein
METHMPAPVLHLGATVFCTHSGVATPTAPFPRVQLSKQPVVTIACPYAIAGCALSGSGNPPCATGQFMMGASTCIPTGSPLMPASAQPRVLAT